ncbi:MAG: hypothetical protein JKY33_07280 [Bacteroidia bacterium]|nr:hypothetical protein [Bacteroidia bacterium]
MSDNMDNHHSSFYYWRLALSNIYGNYKKYRPKTKYLIPAIYIFFIFLNIICYWFAMMTAFPDLVFNTNTGYHYFKVQFPVGIFAGLFDTVSFFVTLIIIQNALRSTSNFRFIAHLSIDLLIGILATLYVLLIFHVSPWMISLIEGIPEELVQRNELMQQRVFDSLNSPFENWRNIYFGIVMGISAMLPTFVHVYMALNFLIVKKLEDKRTRQF